MLSRVQSGDPQIDQWAQKWQSIGPEAEAAVASCTKAKAEFKERVTICGASDGLCRYAEFLRLQNACAAWRALSGADLIESNAASLSEIEQSFRARLNKLRKLRRNLRDLRARNSKSMALFQKLNKVCLRSQLSSTRP
jgi:hypothetical protein